METKVLYKANDGVLTCGDIGISTDEWVDLLQKEKAKQYIDALLCFLRAPEHRGTCSGMELKYGKNAQHYNSKITWFSEWAQKELGRFRVVRDNGEPAFWCIAMKGSRETKHGFEWQLRDELVEALRVYLVRNLVNLLKQLKPFNGYDEEYKWELIDNAEGKEAIGIAKLLIGNKIVDNARNDAVFMDLVSSKPEDFSACLDRLFDVSASLDNRLATFKSEMQNLCLGKWNNCANDERTAAALLTCKYPEKYTFYKDEIYQLLCQYFGYEYQNKAGQKLSHFLQIINYFVAVCGDEVQDVMAKEIEQYRNKPLNLAVQTLFWCMKEYMKNQMKNKKINYWLVGFTFADSDSQLDRFYSEGIWESWYNDDKSSDKNLLTIAQSIKKGDVLILKSTSTKGSKHDIPFLRIKGIGIVENDIESIKAEKATKCRCDVRYFSMIERDFEGNLYGSYRKTIHHADAKVKDIINYVNEMIELQNTESVSKYQQYIDLLKETHNLVLTGAPGTGKTYMAQAMAEEMGCGKEEMCFVQFHPSYDYTDFVEGLRPVEKSDGQMGFERKDGVFKAFCKKAAKNLVDSQKAVETLTKELSWEEQFQLFINDAIEKRTPYELTNRNKFTIEEIKDRIIIVRNDNNEKTTRVSVNADDIIELLANDVQLNIVKDIRDYFKRKYGTQPDSYAFVIVNKIREMKKKVTVKSADKIDRKDFVFIIDEINRGEASKIFGELFYAIDPGYREKKDIRVKTQYQNLVPESDVFADGFYVPENVYILATMNDIDRSVESMDFAMRRRFTWKEIAPEDTEYMLDKLDCADEAKATMHRLNKEIASVDGLGSAYSVGPSYFLKLRDNGCDFTKLWKMNIEPLLKEYLRGFRKTEDLMEKLETAYYNKTNTLDAVESGATE